MPFKTAKSKLKASKQAALDLLLSDWDAANDIYQNAAENLRNEHGFAADDFPEYLGEIASNHSDLGASPIGPKAKFEEISKPFELKGYTATPHAAALFGRAIRFGKYCSFLETKLDELKCPDIGDEVKNTIRRLEGLNANSAPSRFRVYFEGMRQTLLGKHATFATFIKPVLSAQHPWGVPSPDAQTIRSEIGLGEDPDNEDYILFAYNLPFGMLPRVPVTASPGWDYQRWFRPNPRASSDLHGWTAPISFGSRRPEIVHPEIDGSGLVFPIYIAKR